MRFIDTNILAYAFYANEFQNNCQEIIKKGGMINTINLIEALIVLENIIDRRTAITFIKGLLKSNLVIINTDITLFFEALKRADKYKNLNFIDLIHYTTALLNNCESIASYDADFDNLELKRETT